MAKSMLKEWLSDGKRDLLIRIIRESRTDKEIYQLMEIDKATFYRYMENCDFCDLVKRTKEQRAKRNFDRLEKLHEAMWEKATGYVTKETIREVTEKTGEHTHEVVREFSHDSSLMIYLDKTYGSNAQNEEIRSRIELNQARAEAVRVSMESEAVEDLDEIREEVYGQSE